MVGTSHLGGTLAEKALRGCCLMAGCAWASSMAWKQNVKTSQGWTGMVRRCRGMIIPLSSWVIRLSVLWPLLNKDTGYLEYQVTWFQQETLKLLAECSWLSLEKSWVWGNLTLINLAEGKMEKSHHSGAWQEDKI